MLFAPANSVKVPRNLESVTTLDPKMECDPCDVGMTKDQVENIWKSVECFYKSRLQPGMTLVIRRKGEIVLKRAIGHARGELPGSQEAPQLMHPDTPICLFSASKGITAFLIHALVEKGLIELDAPVSRYIPEFGVNGKERITIRHVLSHRAGVSSIPMKDPDPSLLYQWDNVVGLLNAAKAAHEPGQGQAYHAITGGFVLGEVARRVTGKEMNELLKETFADPLGCEFFSYGLPHDSHNAIASNHVTGGLSIKPVQMVAKRALGIDFHKIGPISNTKEFRNAVIPAANIYANADEVSRFYQMTLNGGTWNGQQVLQPETIKEAVRPAASIGFDRTLLVPIRYSAGLMLGESLMSLYGPKAEKAYGHLGLLNIVCWADPARDISVSFLNTGKTVDPRGFTGMLQVVWAIGKNCPIVN